MDPCTGCFTINTLRFADFFSESSPNSQIPLGDSLWIFGQLSCHKRSQSVILSETNSSHLGWLVQAIVSFWGLAPGCELGGYTHVISSRRQGITGWVLQRCVIIGEVGGLIQKASDSYGSNFNFQLGKLGIVS